MNLDTLTILYMRVKELKLQRKKCIGESKRRQFINGQIIGLEYAINLLR